MHSNWDTCRTARIFSVVGRLCLVVSLWQGPLPWLHCHGTKLTEISSAVTASNLRLHLASFHRNEEEELGWHFHWVLPCWNHFFEKNCQHDSPSRESVSLDSIATQTTVASSLQGLAMAEVAFSRFVPDIGLKTTSLQQRKVRCKSPLPREMSAVLRC